MKTSHFVIYFFNYLTVNSPEAAACVCVAGLRGICGGGRLSGRGPGRGQGREVAPRLLSARQPGAQSWAPSIQFNNTIYCTEENKSTVIVHLVAVERLLISRPSLAQPRHSVALRAYSLDVILDSNG